MAGAFCESGTVLAKLLVDRNAARWLRKLEEHGYLPDIRSAAESAAA